MDWKKIGKYVFLFLVFVGLVTFMVFHSYYFTQMYSLDEIWNYGFSKSILDGLVPYVDYSMIVPPLFPYLAALFLGIFGQSLLVYHVFIALICVTIVFVAYKEMGWGAISVYVLLLIYATNGYNTISLLFLFLLLRLSNRQDKWSAVLSAVWISCMILSKHSFALLIIPSLLYNRYRKETFLVYVVVFLGFVGYLIFHDNLLGFIDYCFLGMSEFATKNTFSGMIYFVVQVIVCIVLGIFVLKTRGKKKDVFYVLLYQVIAFPITDFSHFVLAWAAVAYLIFKYRKYLCEFQGYVSVLFVVFHVFILVVMDYSYTFKGREYYENFPTNSFMKGRLVPVITKDYLSEIKEFRDRYPDYHLYVFGNYGYIVKLYLGEEISRYDLINYGNMGKKESAGYIEEIDQVCQKEKCLFIVNTAELDTSEYHQTSVELLQYPINHYKNVRFNLAYSIYMN